MGWAGCWAHGHWALESSQQAQSDGSWDSMGPRGLPFTNHGSVGAVPPPQGPLFSGLSNGLAWWTGAAGAQLDSMSWELEPGASNYTNEAENIFK